MRRLAPLLSLLCAMVAAQARAAPTPPGYQEAIGAAVQEYKAGNWTEAIMLFRRAHGLAPSARTHRGLGLCYFEARKYVAAVEHLTAALDEARRPLDAAQRGEVQAALTRARTMVGELVVRASPQSAQVIVDGSRRAQVGQPIALDAGSHAIEVRAEGHAAQQRTVDIVGEQRNELLVELERAGAGAGALREPVAPSAGEAPEAGSVEDESRGGGVSAGPIIVLAVGAAALGGALVTGLMVQGKDGELVDAGCETSCGTEHEATRQDARTLQTATNVLLAAGGAVLAAGAVWLWLDLAADESEPAGVSAAALCTGEGCAGVLRGTF